MTYDTRIPRRSVTAGAAWAVPAVTFAAAAPSLAASDTGTAGSQTLTQSIVGELRSWEWDPWPATATLSVTVPTTAHVGAVIVPQVSMSLTAAEFESHYSGEHLRGNVRIWYGLGAAGEVYQRNYTEGITFHRDANGHAGLIVGSAGEAVTVTDETDIGVSIVRAYLDTYFGDGENDFWSNIVATPTPMGTITVLP